MIDNIDFKTDDVTYIALNIGDLRSDESVKADGDWRKFRRCNREFEMIPMTEENIKCLFESLSCGEILQDHRFFDAKQFRSWLYGDRKSAPKPLNWKLREKYTIPAREKDHG